MSLDLDIAKKNLAKKYNEAAWKSIFKILGFFNQMEYELPI